MDLCTRCEIEVTNDAEALQCDLCSEWEHRICIRECDRPSVELYAALTTGPCKAILFVCSQCRRKGDVARRLFQLKNASECANERSQAAERLLLERQVLVETLQVHKGAVQKEISRLLVSIDEWRRKAEARQFMDESASVPELLDVEKSESLLKGESDEACSKLSSEANKTASVNARQETSTKKVSQLPRSDKVLDPAKKTQSKRTDRELSDKDIDSRVVSQDESLPSTDSDEVDTVLPRSLKPVATQAQAIKQQGNVIPYPPGFKQIQERVGRFTGKCGEEDFEVWLADFREATADCKWTDEQRAQWFSWFLSGATKSTWQRTLRKEEKKSWTDIVRIYKGHCGVHMEPHTVYLRCHELRYEDFASVKGLLGSMKDYQRKAPDQLTDDNLLSILWNKAPYRLQKEVGDIKDWSLQ